MSSIPRLKCLSYTRAQNITSFDALAFRYHACNSCILVGSRGINSSHIRGSPNLNGFLFDPGWTLISPPWSWAFVRPLSSTNWAIAWSFLESTFRGVLFAWIVVRAGELGCIDSYFSSHRTLWSGGRSPIGVRRTSVGVKFWSISYLPLKMFA